MFQSIWGYVIALFLIFIVFPVGSTSAMDSAAIRIEGDTLYFKGKIEGQTAADIFEKVDSRTIRKIIVSSSGGEVMAAMDIGLWMYENNIDIEIDTMCFSSCANYLFTAADHKTIPRGAVVAWHGDLRQFDVTPAELTKKIREMADEVSDEAIGHLVESMRIYHEAGIKKQEAFFAKIGVSPDICSIGSQYGAEEFFLLSVEDMEFFGVDNIDAPEDYLLTDVSDFNKYVPVTAVKIDSGLQPAD